MTGTVYLSGPISGKTYNEARFGWRKKFADQMWYKRHGVGLPHNTLLSPMRHEGHLSEVKGPLEKEYPENLFSHPKMIVAKDFLDIQMSDIVLVYLLDAGTRVSIGTMVELGYAKALGKTIVTVMDKDNVHVHPFVTEVSDTVVPRLEDAVAIIDSLLSEGI